MQADATPLIPPTAHPALEEALQFKLKRRVHVAGHLGELVPLALRMFNSQDSVTQYGQMFAMSILSLVPIFLFFLIFQRTLSHGVTAGAIK